MLSARDILWIVRLIIVLFWKTETLNKMTEKGKKAALCGNVEMCEKQVENYDILWKIVVKQVHQIKLSPTPFRSRVRWTRYAFLRKFFEI